MKKIAKQYGKLILNYSLFFIIISVFILLVFFKYHKGFIWANDGLQQHYITLVTFKNMLIKFLTTGSFDLFTWNIGLGVDMFANFAYYIFGDFFSYFSIFIPQNYTYLFYYFLVFLRLYFVGLSFIAFTKYKKIKDEPCIIGALMYTFCAFSLFSFVRHPYFINALILFPLLLLALERIILENRKIMFIAIVFIMYVSSFYFAYMMSLCAFIYGVILIIFNYHKEGIKQVMKKLIMVFMCALLGVLLSAFVLFPTAMEFLASNRSGTDVNYIYSNYYYTNLLTSLISFSNSNWVILGINGLALLTLPLAIKYWHKNKSMILFLTILLIPLVVVQVGSLFAGFSYPNERWTYVISFILSFLTASILNEKNNITKSDFAFILSFIIIYLLLNIWINNDFSKIMTFNLVTFLGFLLLYYNKQKIINFSKKINIYKIAFTTFLIFTLCVSTYLLFGVGGDQYAGEFVNFNMVDDTVKNNNNYKNFEEIINYTTDSDDFYRISRNPIGLYNISMLDDFNSYNYFYSIMPSQLNELAYDLDNFDYMTSTEIGEFNYRTKITTLLANKYYITNYKKYVPYGYELIKKQNDSYVYQNNYSLPFALYYDTYINSDDYNRMNSLEKEDSLLKTVVLNGADEKYVSYDNKIKKKVKSSLTDIDYELKTSGELKKKSFTAEKANDKITLTVNSNVAGEYYLKINNLSYTAFDKSKLISLKQNDKYDVFEKQQLENQYKFYQTDNSSIISVTSDKIDASKAYNDPRMYQYASNTSSFVLNLGNYDSYNDTITITFEREGVYTFDSIEIVTANFDSYEADINSLKQSNFTTKEYGNNYLIGTASIENKGLLQFSTTYSKGWDVYVDDKKVKTLCVNNYFLGVYIDEGKHKIELKYSTPYLKQGLIISSVALVILIIMIFRRKCVLD